MLVGLGICQVFECVILFTLPEGFIEIIYIFSKNFYGVNNASFGQYEGFMNIPS